MTCPCFLGECVLPSLALAKRKGKGNTEGFEENHVPISPATSESSPEKTKSQSAKSAALHSRTTMDEMTPFMGAACFHRTASLYCLPAERDDAPSACSCSVGCSARRRMKRCPTEPVAPRTPIPFPRAPFVSSFLHSFTKNLF